MSLKQTLQNILGVKCTYCAGTGVWEGRSPTAPLSTFRPWVKMTCPRCEGRRYVKPGQS